jgi:hypothetical protein
VKKLRIIILIILAILLVLILAKCKPTEEGLNQKIHHLKLQAQALKDANKELLESNDSLRDTQAHLTTSIEALQKEENILKALNEGRRVKYIIKFLLKQEHVSLDPGMWIKDDMNKVKFEMAVDKELYDSLTKGQKIVDNFRDGSLLIDGSIGNWDLSVIDKRIEIQER